MRKICVITGTRAEYGILSNLMLSIKGDDDLLLQIIATNMHLSSEFGLTYKEIENDGFYIDKKVHMLLSSDTKNAVSKSIGLATIGFADAYEDLKPDLLLILGDRYEMLAAATVALIYKIPIAHLYGGEITEGAYDDSIRHALTKMSHLHFTSTKEYKKRVIQLGEEPERVFHVGALGVENIKKTKILSKKQLEKEIKFDLGDKYLLITFHPATLENNTAKQQIENLLKALQDLPEYKFIFTLPNSDSDGRIITEKIKEYVDTNKEKAAAYTSLGKLKYFSTMNYATAVIGNSSSGIVEAPSFHIPVLNIGNRQKGRIAAKSIINCGVSKNEIVDGLQKVLSNKNILKVKKIQNPYEGKNPSKTILKILKQYPLENIIQKSFYDI